VNILCIDSGNTRLKWGLREGDVWCAQGVTTFDQLDALPRTVKRIVACNVAGEAARCAIESLGFSVTWVHAQAQGGGVANGYEEPGQLGADRWAALIAARALHKGPCLVVMSGTATTVDCLDANGRFLGGMILPGLELMRQSLAEGTAALPMTTGVWREWSTNTQDAIESGCLAATLGAIERQFATMTHEPEALCLLSSGAAPALTPHLKLPHSVVDNLVLEGLARYVAT